MCTLQRTYVLVMTSQSISSALSPQSSWLSQTQSFEMQTVHGNSSSAHLSATKNEKKQQQRQQQNQWVCGELVYYYCGHVTAPTFKCYKEWKNNNNNNNNNKKQWVCGELVYDYCGHATAPSRPPPPPPAPHPTMRDRPHHRGLRLLLFSNSNVDSFPPLPIW